MYRWTFLAIFLGATAFGYEVLVPGSGLNGMALLAALQSQNLILAGMALALIFWGIIVAQRVPPGIAARMIPIFAVCLVLEVSAMFLAQLSHLPRVSLIAIWQMAAAFLPLGLGFAIVNGSRVGV